MSERGEAVEGRETGVRTLLRVRGLPTCRLVTAALGPRWLEVLVPVRVGPATPRRPPGTLLEEEVLTATDGWRTAAAIRRTLECGEAAVAEALERLVRGGWLGLRARRQ